MNIVIQMRQPNNHISFSAVFEVKNSLKARAILEDELIKLAEHYPFTIENNEIPDLKLNNVHIQSLE